MKTLDRYLLRELAQSVAAVLVVLLLVSLGAVFAKVLADIAAGKVPAGLMLSQFGLQSVRYLPMILPLALMLGVLLAVGRLYRDAEMPVLASMGVGPRRFLGPFLWLLLPVVLAIALVSLWLGPLAKRTAKAMVAEANRNLLVAGLEPGRFVELANGGVVYVGTMSNDGATFTRAFIYQQKDDRIDVTTSTHGRLQVGAPGERYLQLDDGFRVEGPLGDGKDYRLMRYKRNDVHMPSDDEGPGGFDPQQLSLRELLADGRPEATAQLHARIAPPLLALAFALLAVPLARSQPRQARYGRILTGFVAYVFAINLTLLGTGWLGDGKLPMAAGLWWLLLPALAVGIWMYVRDGALRPWWKRGTRA